MERYKKFYALVVILIPVLYQYNTLGGVLDFDVIAMVLVLLIGLINRVSSHGRYKNAFSGLLLYTIIITLVNILIGTKYSEISSIVLRAGRYCLYVYIVCIMNIDYFDYDIAMKIYRKIAYLASLYICLQAVFYYGAGITLPNTIWGSTVTNVAGQEIGRLRAFYSEPAAMAYAMIPFVVNSLFGENYKERDTRLRDAMVVSFAIILSTSGQGIVCLIVIWVIWAFSQFTRNQMNTGKLVVLLFVGVIAIALSGTSIMRFSIGRVLSTDSTGAVSARASGYRTLSLLNPIQLLFGTGYGNYVTENIYGLVVPYRFVNYSSLAEYLFTTGIIGTLILIRIMMRRFRESDYCLKVLIIAIAVLSSGGCPLTGNFLPLYLSFAFCGNRDYSTEMRPC